MVHVIALGGLATWGAAAFVWVGETGVRPGQAITLQAKFAAATDERADYFTIQRRERDVEQVRPEEIDEIAPQPTPIERTSQVAEAPRAVVEIEIEQEFTVADSAAIAERKRTAETNDREVVKDTPARRPARRLASPTIGETGADEISSPSSVAGANVPPQPLSSNGSPVYPPEALRENRQGAVVIRAWVSREGKVLRAEIATSSGTPSLDASALAATKGWRFEPARRDGIAVEHEVMIPVRFRIER